VGAAALTLIVMVAVVQTAGDWPASAVATPVPPPSTTTSGPNLFGNVNTVIDRAMTELPSEAAETSTLTTAGVRVTVNGYPLPVRAIASTVRGIEQSEATTDVLQRHGKGIAAGKRSTTPAQLAKAVDRYIVSRAAATAVPRAVALAVLQELLWQTAQRKGSVVSLARAKAFAQKEMQQYEATAAAGKAPPLPNGQTVQETYESTRAYRAYQHSMTVKNEETAVAAAAGPTTGKISHRTQALVAWLGKVLTTAKVVVAHVDGVSSASQLPNDLPSTR
jgi:hypothetical protein